jgi:hypothetical protein
MQKDYKEGRLPLYSSGRLKTRDTQAGRLTGVATLSHAKLAVMIPISSIPSWEPWPPPSLLIILCACAGAAGLVPFVGLSSADDWRLYCISTYII